MKERPVLFSGPMVRAILDGRKTQTRRIVNPQPIGDNARSANGSQYLCKADGTATGEVFGARGGWATELRCPYGVAGDRLWVRETWALEQALDDQMADDGISPGDLVYEGFHIGYRADGSGVHDHAQLGRWRPSIHMPRWASRITLDVTAVRIERLQDITEADALAEGCERWRCHHPDCTDGHYGPRGAFMELWDEINGERAPWHSNPWVWVVEFKVVQP